MFKSVCFAFICGLVLSACGSVTPAGLLAAARLDPLTTPPDALSVAVSVPPGVRLQDGDAALRLAFTPDDLTQAAPVDVTVPLMVRADGAAPQPLVPRDAVYVLSLSAEDAAAMAAAQKQIIALRAADVEGAGSLAIDVTGGCVLSQMPEVLPVATWLRPEVDGNWVQLTRRRDVFQELPVAQARALRAGLRRC